MTRSRLRAFVLALVALLTLPRAGSAQSFHLTVKAPAELAASAARIEAIRADTLAESLAHAGLPLPPRARVTLIPDTDRRAAVIPEWVAGLASGTDEIVVFPQRIGGYPYDSLESLVLHEVVHLALNLRAGERPLPRWFHEGVAVSVESGWGIGAQARLLIAAAREPGLDDVDRLFASDRAPETSTAYLLSAALVEDIRRRHGLAVPGAIAARVAEGESFDQAFFRVTGETVDEAAVNAWRVYRGLRWLPVLTGTSAIWAAILTLAGIAFVVRVRRRKAKIWDEGSGDDSTGTATDDLK